MWGATVQDARSWTPDAILLIRKGELPLSALRRFLLFSYERPAPFVPSPAAGGGSALPRVLQDGKLSISHSTRVLPCIALDYPVLNRIPVSDANQTGHSSQNWKATVAYDGTDFRGWQVQPGERTIQGELQGAIERVTGEAPLPQGSGRTDAGVHALGQVASFPLAAAIPAANLLRALNRTLPDAIRVLDVRVVPDGFHARHSAVAKTYEYRVFLERPGWPATQESQFVLCPPFLARYVFACPWPLDLAALQVAAGHLVGEHDFTSFAASDPDLSNRAEDGEPVNPVRTIFESRWTAKATDEGTILVYRVRGSGFLHHMVRNLVGTMIDAGRGYTQPDGIQAILAARSRSAAGPTAPARGLFLHSVEYGETEFRP